MVHIWARLAHRARARRVAAVVGLVGLVGVAGVVVGCGGGSGDDPDARPPAPPAVDQIVPAMAAVEDELGGPLRYFEINADPVFVNLFVASDDGSAATPYRFVAGVLGPPGEPLAVGSGTTFVGSDVDLDPSRVLAGVAAELETSTIERFVVSAAADGAPRYEVEVRSSRGGRLAVVVDGAGTVLEVLTLS